MRTVIYGIGTDLVHIERIRRALDRFGMPFATRILTPDELGEFVPEQRKAHFLAKRFAAKEACVKAMGQGFRGGLSLRQIGLLHDPAGRPRLVFSGSAEVFVRHARIAASHVSLSDENDYALAFVVLVQG
ncbi:MAG: holo-ACP synthase [Acidiferrobacteraceae bacterium]